MDRIDEMIVDVLRREGGFVNDPADPGGATNYGVTIHTMRRLGLDLNADGHVDEEDVRALSMERASAIFRAEYFERSGLGRLPTPLQPTVFDMNVNAGGQSIRLLQRVLNGFGADLAVDGALGPLTLAATHRIADDVGVARLVDAYGVERRNYYYRLADRRPASRRFARARDGSKGGWIRRAEEFIAPRWHLSDAQHRARVAAWG
ncbi:holin-associated N-acetylmuramidase [Pontivivens insulae]|uniref:Uncharacterized protein n=1 Tax=Pontivivens insulae TaxID=1639689 RepID=A0A2R8ACM6_9RHOB|nr:holin-associated N-acetylmuramidase [Pontivivens insulae]RED13756.1 putative peptidoglycan binding protein [Pontivivens insulae]SPF29830.1 hypothetical protein POI8812_02151 [Pontivivens insulae]